MNIKHGCLWATASERLCVDPLQKGKGLAGTINVLPWFFPLFPPLVMIYSQGHSYAACAP